MCAKESSSSWWESHLRKSLQGTKKKNWKTNVWNLDVGEKLPKLISSTILCLPQRKLFFSNYNQKMRREEFLQLVWVKFEKKSLNYKKSGKLRFEVSILFNNLTISFLFKKCILSQLEINLLSDYWKTICKGISL